MNPNLVVEIVIREPYRCRATGYVIGFDRIITSGHLGDRETVVPVGTVLEVYFPPEKPGAMRVQKSASVIWAKGGLHDCAVLECLEIPESKNRLPCQIRFEPIASRLQFESRVWCNAGFESNFSGDSIGRRLTSLNGTVAAMSTDQEYLEVDCTHCAVPATEDAWQGASGGAIFVEGELAGIVFRYAKNFGGVKLLAIPICRLLEQCGFSEAANISKDDAIHHEELRKQVASKLLRRLKAVARMTDVWEQLLTELEISSFSDRIDTIKTVQRKLLEQPGLVLQIERVLGACLSEGQPDEAQALAAVQDLLLPLWIDPSVRRRLYREVGKSQVSIVMGAAASPVGAEQCAAHIQKRGTKWIMREGAVEGTSRFSLPTLLLKNVTSESAATSFLRSLAIRILDPALYPPALQAAIESQSQLVQVASSLQAEWDLYRDRLCVALEANSEAGNGVPYLALKLDSEMQAREDQLAMLYAVKKVVPNLLMMELCENERGNSQEVRIANWIRGRFINDSR